MEPTADNNIQPDGSWRDPTAQMAIDIGQGKVNPNGAGYAAVELAHRTYGSDHINGLWGHHANAPAPPRRNEWWVNSPGPAVNRPAPTKQSHAGYGAGYREATWVDRAPVTEQDEPRAGGDWPLVRDVCLGAGVGIVAALVVEFLRR